MFKTETIAKYIKAISEAINASKKNIDNLHVCISKGNQKIGKTMNVSLAPIRTCGGNCRVCKCICYDIKACMQYGNVMNARARNTALQEIDRDRYFAEIDQAMKRRRANKFLRWHVGGDIVDYDYFCRMVENAKNNPDFIVWTYTKQYHIVNQYVKEHGGSIAEAIPSNISIMFSVWKGLHCDNPYGFSTFTCVLKGEVWPHKTYHCTGNCQACIDSGHGCPHQESSAVAEH